MKLAILSRNQRLYSTRRLIDVANARGHEVAMSDVLRCYMNVTANSLQVNYNGRKLPVFDAVIPRIGASVTFYGTALMRQFEMMGTFPLNESVAISRSRDKLRSLQLLSRNGVGMPITGFAYKPGDVKDLIKMVRGAPLVIKLLEGAKNMRVHVLHVKKPGPVLFLSSAIHGDELNGIEIIRAELATNLLSKIKGTLIAVPVVNAYGLILLSRYLSDRRDLN